MCLQFSMGCRIWKPVAEELVLRGKRRVVIYDLYGRGHSDAAYPCDLSLFTGPSVPEWMDDHDDDDELGLKHVLAYVRSLL